MHAHPSTDVLRYLEEVPDGLQRALDHHVLSSLTDADRETVIEALRNADGPWQYRANQLHA
jgi:hypothetical protein